MPAAPINAGFGNSPDEVYKLQTTTGGVVRATGTFTSDLGLTAFLASTLAIGIAIWVMPAYSRPIRLPLLMAAMASLVTSLGVSGSRGALLWSGAIALRGDRRGSLLWGVRCKLRRLLPLWQWPPLAL